MLLLFIVLYKEFICDLQRCELCPQKDGALKRTDTGGRNILT